MDSKEIKLVNSKGNHPWILIGRTDAKAETPILWSLDVKSQLIGKDPDAGKDWGQEEKGQQRMRWFVGITDSMDMSLSKLRETEDRGAWNVTVHGVTTKRLNKNSTFPTLQIYPPGSCLPEGLPPSAYWISFILDSGSSSFYARFVCSRFMPFTTA